eukprot:c26038_g1_i1 orf=2-271(-)
MSMLARSWLQFRQAPIPLLRSVTLGPSQASLRSKSNPSLRADNHSKFSPAPHSNRHTPNTANRFTSPPLSNPLLCEIEAAASQSSAGRFI